MICIYIYIAHLSVLYVSWYIMIYTSSLYIYIYIYKYISVLQINYPSQPINPSIFPGHQGCSGNTKPIHNHKGREKKQHQKCVISKFELFLLNVPMFLVDIEAFCYTKNRSQKFFATPGWSASPHWIWSCWACPTGLPSGKETVGPWK